MGPLTAKAAYEFRVAPLFQKVGIVLFVLVFGGLAVVALALGCVVTHAGDTTTWHYPHGLALLLILAGVLLLPASLAGVVKGVLPPQALVAALLCSGTLVVVSGWKLVDSVSVSNAEFTVHSGLTRKTVAYADLTGIAVTAQQDDSQHPPTVVYTLECRRKDGSVEKIPVTHLMQLGAEARILQAARWNHLSVQDPGRTP